MKERVEVEGSVEVDEGWKRKGGSRWKGVEMDGRVEVSGGDGWKWIGGEKEEGRVEVEVSGDGWEGG
ncbi:hypothetical protein Pcinc_031677, partial [Petrolisthes cinctipes]